MKRRKTSNAVPASSLTAEERLAFAQFLHPIYEQEWQSEITSAKPSWMYLAILHRRLREFEQCQ